MRECEELCAKKQGLTVGSRGWLATASRQIEAHVPLELTTQPSRKVKLPEHPIWQNMTFHIPSHPTIYIYTLIPTI